MDRIEREEVYRMAVACFGKPPQKLMAIEEMSELTKAICKDFRGKLNRENLVEEMADVQIMLEQLKIIYDAHEAVDAAMELKIKRLRQLLNMDMDD